MKKAKRLLAILLSVCLLFGMIPMSALAEGEPAVCFMTFRDGETGKLSDDSVFYELFSHLGGSALFC